MNSEPEPLRVVVDTNVLVSALHFDGRPASLLRLLRSGDFEWFISPFILDELERVLREKFRWEPTEIQRSIGLLSSHTRLIDPPATLSVIREKDEDNRILDCAVQARAHFLISGDKRHILPLGAVQGVRILSPAEFMSHLTRSAP